MSNIDTTYQVSQSKKDKKILDTLLKLVELYIETNKPVGSHLLQQVYFQHISSATLRNYFSELDKNGYLIKAHTSGGRTPTEKAFRVYHDFNPVQYENDKNDLSFLNTVRSIPIQHNVVPHIEKHMQQLSNHLGHMAFITAPSFETDTISDIKLIYHNTQKCIALITSFYGFLQCEEIILPSYCDKTTLDILNDAIQMKLDKHDDDIVIEHTPHQVLFESLYQEIIMRFISQNIARQHSKAIHSGIHNLIKHSEFNSVHTISQVLNVFNDDDKLKQTLTENESISTSTLIGSEAYKQNTNVRRLFTLLAPR